MKKKPKNLSNRFTLFAAASGNALEWFNFIAFIYLSNIISQLFFPSDSSYLALIKTYFLYALGFAARPLGGVIFGYIGDKLGRRINLIISISLMTISTVLMGFLPTYHSLGTLAPILLVILRLIQGISVGGEYTGSVVYIYEQAPINKRGFWVSFMPMTIAIGILLGSFVTFTLLKIFDAQQMLRFAWRIVFYVGGIFGVIIFFLRQKLIETPSFIQLTHSALPQKKEHYFKNILVNHIRPLIMLFFLVAYNGIKYQILFIWMPNYLQRWLFVPETTALAINSIIMLLFCLFMPLVGKLADLVTAKKLMIGALLFDLITTYPLFLMLTHLQNTGIVFSLLIMAISFSFYNVSISVFMMSLFPVSIRVSGISYSYNLAFALFGGTTPLIAVFLIHLTKINTAPALYLIAACIIALLSLRNVHEIT